MTDWPAAALAALAFSLASCVQMTLLSVATPLLAGALSSRSDDEQSARLIAELEKKQDWTALSQLARERLARVPEDPDWSMILGYAQMQLGEHQSAARIFARLVERTPEDIDGWNMLGEAQRRDGRYGAAVRTLEHAATIDPASAITRHLLAESLRSDGRLERAKSEYREALRLEPRLARAWFGLGTVLAQTGPREELQAVLELLQALDPSLGAELARMQAGKN